jgi:hypothetical protein
MKKYEKISKKYISDIWEKIHLGHMGKNGGHMATEHFSDIWENMADI